MIYSAGVTQLALVAYVPDAEHNKSASKIDVQVWIRARVQVQVQVQVQVWIDHVLKTSTYYGSSHCGSTY